MNGNLLFEFLTWLLTSAGSGLAVFAAIQFLEKIWPAGRQPLSGEAKFYLSILLAFLFPLLAYLGLVALGAQAMAPEGIFSAVAAGWVVSQGLHRSTETAQAA